MRSQATTILLLSAGILISACGGESDTTAPTSIEAESLTTAARADPTTTSSTVVADPTIPQLCAVLNAASAGEVDVARSTFDHGPLHTLADTAIDIDRGVAARLLEAKEAVEADLAGPGPDGPTLVTDLEALIVATSDALVATGTPSPPTCDSENQ